jgi:predicted outer membrane repeat protein
MPSIPSARPPRRSRARLGWCVAALCALAPLAPRAAGAQEQRPTIVDRCGTDVDAGGTNLATALAAGGPVRFACGGQATIRVTRPHSITRGVDLDGAGQITLDGNNDTPFLVAGAPDLTVRLANVTIRRMASTNQAGVVGAPPTLAVHVRIVASEIRESDLPFAMLNGDVTAENSVFERNTNAVFNAPVVTLKGSKVRFNDAIPILSRAGRVEVSDSSFEGNTRGSVFRGCSEARIVRTSFVGNTTGGAFATGCVTDVDNGTFTGNTSQGNGGAIRVSSAAQRVTIRGSRFTDNAAANGGAIAIEPAAATALTVVLQHTIFKNNRAASGGAVFVEEPAAGATATTRVMARAATFSANVTTDRGGAVAGRHAVLDMSRSVFLRNAAPTGGAVWSDAPVNRPSVFVNSLFALNRSPAGAYVGRAASFINATVLGSEGPGLALLPAPAGGSLHLANTIVENNSGGNCRAETGRVVDEGANLQFPGETCGPTIPVSAALLDTFYAPMVGGPARARGLDAVCKGPKVQGHDLYGRKRPFADHCSIGAVEGDLEQMMKSLRATPAGTPGGDPRCPDGSVRTSRGCDGRRDDPDGRRRDDRPGGTREPGAADCSEADRRAQRDFRPNPGPASTGPFLRADAVLPLLLRSGVDFSVSPSDIRDFLDNSEFTPYPAIADALLRLTQARPLRCSVFLDVIVFNYEHTRGVKSPRTRADVNLDLLRSNVVEGYNERYGTTHRTFESLLR